MALHAAGYRREHRLYPEGKRWVIVRAGPPGGGSFHDDHTNNLIAGYFDDGAIRSLVEIVAHACRLTADRAVSHE